MADAISPSVTSRITVERGSADCHLFEDQILVDGRCIGFVDEEWSDRLVAALLQDPPPQRPAAEVDDLDLFGSFDPTLFGSIGVPIAAAFRSLGQLRGLIQDEDAGVSAALVDAAFMQAHMLGLAEIIADAHPDDSRDEAMIAAFAARLRETVVIARLL